jgi:hypothetical protein
MRGKARTDAAALAAQEIVSSIKGWIELSNLLMQAGSVASAAESATRAELWTTHGPKGLLNPVVPPMPAPAALHELVESRKAQALQAHRAAWSASPPYAWLCAQPGFAMAMRRLLKRRKTTTAADDLLHEATVTRLIVNEIEQWAIIRTGRETHDLRLYLTRKQMRDAAALATRLEQALGAAIWSGSAVTRESFRSGYRDIKHQSLRGILKQLAVDLRERDSESGRAPRNDSSTADRHLIAALATRFCLELSDRDHRQATRMRSRLSREHRRAIHAIVLCVGVDLEWENVDIAIDKALGLFG